MVGIVQDKKYCVKEIKRILPNSSIIGNKDNHFSNARSIQQADSNSIIWIKSRHKNSSEIIVNTKASFIICSRDVEVPENVQKNKCFIVVDNPRLSFAKILKYLFVDEIKFGIDGTAIIHANAKIGNNVFIGPNTYVGNVEIGEGTIVYGNAYLYDGVKIGKNCIIHAGAIIGADGFGFEKNRNGEWIKFPQIGGVRICNNVEIGANSTIDRGALEDTFIGEGVKIDNLCQIGHNVCIGNNTIITGGVEIGGSTCIGENCWIAPNVSIINKITVSKEVFIGIGSVVIRSIKKPNTKYFGNPAKRISEYYA